MVIPSECAKCSNSDFFISRNGYAQEIECKTCGHKITYSLTPQAIEKYSKQRKKAFTGLILAFTSPILFIVGIALIGGFIALIGLIFA